jgi:hypothetical protein
LPSQPQVLCRTGPEFSVWTEVWRFSVLTGRAVRVSVDITAPGFVSHRARVFCLDRGVEVYCLDRQGCEGFG